MCSMISSFIFEMFLNCSSGMIITRWVLLCFLSASGIGSSFSILGMLWGGRIPMELVKGYFFTIQVFSLSRLFFCFSKSFLTDSESSGMSFLEIYFFSFSCSFKFFGGGEFSAIVITNC